MDEFSISLTEEQDKPDFHMAFVEAGLVGAVVASLRNR